MSLSRCHHRAKDTPHTPPSDNWARDFNWLEQRDGLYLHTAREAYCYAARKLQVSHASVNLIYCHKSSIISEETLFKGDVKGFDHQYKLLLSMLLLCNTCWNAPPLLSMIYGFESPSFSVSSSDQELKIIVKKKQKIQVYTTNYFIDQWMNYVGIISCSLCLCVGWRSDWHTQKPNTSRRRP